MKAKDLIQKLQALDPETKISIQKFIPTGGQPSNGGDERIYFETGYLIKDDPNDLYGFFIDYNYAHSNQLEPNEETGCETFLDFTSECVTKTIRLRPDNYLTLSEKI